VREQGSGTREVLDAALEPWGGVTSRLELGSSAAVLAAARKGEGPAVLSQLAAEHDLGTGELGAVATDGIDLSRTIQAVWASDTNLGHLARRLLAVAARSSSS
jgi:DNA-binding transcriptional LysR family regulator